MPLACQLRARRLRGENSRRAEFLDAVKLLAVCVVGWAALVAGVWAVVERPAAVALVH